MLSRSSIARVTRFVLPATLLVAGACKSGQTRPPAPMPESHRAEITGEFTATAQVTALAPAERKLTLRREDGAQIDVVVAEGVRNFEQIAVGDALRVRYKETLAATKLPPGESAKPLEGAFAAARAKPGAKPGGGMGMAVSLRVKIESIDRTREIVVFSLASGELIARRLQTAEGRELVQELEIGDLVQLDYTETLALGIEKL